MGRSCSLICAILCFFQGPVQQSLSIHSPCILRVNIVFPLFSVYFLWFSLKKNVLPYGLKTFNEKIIRLKQITTNWVVLYGLTVQEEKIYFQTGLGFISSLFFPFSFPLRIIPCGTLKSDLRHIQHINVSLLSEVMCSACYPPMREKKDSDCHADSDFLPALHGDKGL